MVTYVCTTYFTPLDWNDDTFSWIIKHRSMILEKLSFNLQQIILKIHWISAQKIDETVFYYVLLIMLNYSRFQLMVAK